MSKLPDISYDARRGWFRFTPSGRLKPIKGEPFQDAAQATAYALKQLQSEAVGLYSVTINARKALEWAAALSPTDGAPVDTPKVRTK